MPKVIRGNVVKCSVPGCDAPHRARGLCNTHYHYARRHKTLPPRLYPEGCSVEECSGELEARGLCQVHYRRWRKTGSVELISRTAEDRFWEKVERRGADECWPWLGSHSPSGHGTFWSGERATGAHRFSYELANGPIPEGLVIDHLCCNGACVNPSHMEPVTFWENNRRGTSPSSRNLVKTHCPRGHAYDEANTYVDKIGRRSCVACRREAERRHQEAKRLERLQG